MRAQSSWYSRQQPCVWLLIVAVVVCMLQQTVAFTLTPVTSSSRLSTVTSLHKIHRGYTVHRTGGSLFATSSHQPQQEKKVLLEVTVKQSTACSTAEEAQIIARSGLYRHEEKADKKVLVVQSSIYKFVEFATNPFAVIFGIYFFAFGYGRIVSFFSGIFNRGGAVKEKPTKVVEEVKEDQPFQVFQCQRCGMQLRPARGRAEKIFANERFRCARCGSKASSYFNIDDMKDPRAVARVEKLKREEEEREKAEFGEDEEEEADEEE